MLETVATFTGKLVLEKELNTKRQEGIGSGIFIDKTTFMTAKHCYDIFSSQESSKNLYVVLGAYEYEIPSKAYIKVERSLSQEEAKAKKVLNTDGDIILLKVEENDINPKERECYPKISELPIDEYLYLFAYRTGTHLKISLNIHYRTNTDQVITFHSTDQRSSGGIYINTVGNIVAVHRGCKDEEESYINVAVLPSKEFNPLQEIKGIILENNVKVSVKDKDKVRGKLMEWHDGSKREIYITLDSTSQYNKSSAKYHIEENVHNKDYTKDANSFYADVYDKIANNIFVQENYKFPDEFKLFGYTFTKIPDEEEGKKKKKDPPLSKKEKKTKHMGLKVNKYN